MNLFQKLRNYILTEKWYFTFILVVINLANSLYRFITYRSLTEFISQLIETQPTNSTHILIKLFTKLCLSHLVHIATNYFLRKSITKRVNMIFTDLVSRMVHYDAKFFNHYGREEFLQIWGYLYNVENMIKDIILEAPSITIYLLYYTYTIYNFSSFAVICVLSINILIIASLHPFSKKQYMYHKKRLQLDLTTKNNYMELVNNINHIKLNCKEIDEKNRVLDSYNMYYKNKDADNRISYITNAISAIINDVVKFVIYIIGITYVLNSSMKPIELLYLAVHTGNFYYQLNDLKNIYNNYKRMVPKLTILFDMLEYNCIESDNLIKYKQLDILNENIIEFDDVTFAYDEKNILVNKTFNFKRNNINLLIGPNGSGKSTIINLLMKLYKLNSNNGNIYYNGVDIKELLTSTIRKKITIIYQEASLFNESLWYNIIYGIDKKLIDKNLLDKIYELSEHMDFRDFIDKHKERKIGFMGEKLSGGEKKKVQLINALIQNPDIMVFDEPTNALDVDTTKWLISFIKKIKHKYGKTVLIITHDKRMVEIADHVVELD
jgi:ATP-binding cassette, subfamily B, bacterial MsbA